MKNVICRTLIFWAILLSCANVWASGVDYGNVCGISRYLKRQDHQALQLKVRFKSGEALCTKGDGCFAARYVATVLEGPPEEVDRDVTIISSANVVLGKRYLIFARKIGSSRDANFRSEIFYRDVPFEIPEGIEYFTSQEIMFRLYGTQYTRTVPAGAICGSSPDCDWVDAHRILDSEAVANIEVSYPKLEEELKVCEAEPSNKPYEVYIELNEKASRDASKGLISPDPQQ